LHLVALYNKALSAGEVQQNQSAGPWLTPPDTQSPTLLAVTVSAPDTLRVLFSEPLDPISAQAVTNYSLGDGVSIAAAWLEFDTRTVMLTLSALPYGNHVLTVNHVRDLAAPANAVAANSQMPFTYLNPAPPAPVILSVAVLNSNDVRLSWSAVSNRVYSVRYRPDMNSEWTPLAGEVTATNGVATYIDNTGLAPQRFYQVFLP
jgi:hypothetical protein